MAGQPQKRAVLHELHRRALEAAREFDPEIPPESVTALDYAVDWVEGGRTLAELARELSEVLGREIHRQVLSRTLHRTFPEEADSRLRVARSRGAYGMAERSVELADTSGASRDEIAKARLQGTTRQWLAEKWNRAEFGNTKQDVNVNLTIDGAHIDSLRARAVTTPQLPSAEPEAAEYEVLEETL